MSSRIFTQVVALPPLGDARRIHLVFHPYRARIVRWQPSQELRGLRWSLSGKGRLANVLTLEVLDPKDASTSVVVHSDGPAQLVARVVEDPHTVRSFPPSTSSVPATVPSGGNGFAPTAQLQLDTQTLLEELWGILEPGTGARPSGPLWNYRRFFADLDRHSDPNLRNVYLKAKDPVLLERMEIHGPVVRATLWDRISHRQRDPAHGFSRLAYPGAAVVAEDVRFVSDLLLRLLHQHIGNRFGLLDLDGVHEAFEMFANGELRLPLPSQVVTTQPSSGLFFFFGEFALLAAECGIQEKLWTRIASAMIGAQRIYCRVYPPRSGATDPTLFDYLPENHAPEMAFTASEKEALRREYQGRSLDELCIAQAAHLERFARGSLPASSGDAAPAPGGGGGVAEILTGLGAMTEEQSGRMLEFQANGGRKLFGDTALENGVISPAQHRKALELQRRRGTSKLSRPEGTTRSAPRS